MKASARARKKDTPQYMVPLMTGPQRVIFHLLVLMWLATLVWFWSWWLEGDHLVTDFGRWMSSFVLFCTTALPAWFFWFARVAKTPNPKLPLPKGSVGIFVTKVPSESFKKIIIPTLMGAIKAAQKYRALGYKVTIYLCDENPKHDTDRIWCEARGIEIISRLGKPEFNNDQFPFRARTKEGNLGYAYHLLKSEGRLPDFLIQLDSDHIPTPDYVVEIMRAFIDPKVGYVAAPSICGKNFLESWVVRARLFGEATMHGILQSGYLAPLPIGSHYALRAEAFLSLEHHKPKSFWDSTVAVVARATLGPDLAEDHSTGLAMNACGWKGAFAIHAIANGDGPSTFADSITQEFQWSRSLMVLFLNWTRMYFRSPHMSLGVKVQFLFSQVWYPIFSCYMLVGVVMPPLALLVGKPWVSVHYSEWLLHSFPLVGACLLPSLYLKHLRFLRPDDAPIMSWELFMFPFFRWPWALWGCVHAFIGVVLMNRELPFKVTPKGVTGVKPLPFKAIAPYVLIILSQLIPVMLVSNPGQAQGYAWFSLLNAASYTVVLAVILCQHARENAHAMQGKTVVGHFPKQLAITVAVLVLVIFSFAWKGPRAMEAVFFETVAPVTIQEEQPTASVAVHPTQQHP